METWFPTSDAAVDSPISDLVADPDDRATYDALLAAAPADCPTRTLSAQEAVADGGPWPVIAMSHCYGCTRFSTATIAERLATFGYVVVAPDHAGDTLFDHLDGTGLPLDTDTLALREADLGLALDSALAGDLGVSVDPDRIGVFGHSFGAVTAGKLQQDRAGSVRAGMFVGAPPENPLLAGVDVATLDGTLLFLELAEDHSVGAAGNILIEQNFEKAPGPAWLVEMADAGHWSPSDLVGLTEDFMPGCGADTRQEDGADFTYLDPATGRATSASLAAAFYAATLDGDTDAAAWIDAAVAPLAVTTK